MRDILKIWLLLRIHKGKLCNPFHYKKDLKLSWRTRRKGWCPVLAQAHKGLKEDE